MIKSYCLFITRLSYAASHLGKNLSSPHERRVEVEVEVEGLVTIFCSLIKLSLT